MTSKFPGEPIDLSYEHGIQTAHVLSGDGSSLFRFLLGFVSEVAAIKGSTEPSQIRVLHQAVIAVTTAEFRKAHLADVDRSVVERQLGSLLTSTYRAYAKQQSDSSPKGK